MTSRKTVDRKAFLKLPNNISASDQDYLVFGMGKPSKRLLKALADHHERMSLETLIAEQNKAWDGK